MAIPRAPLPTDLEEDELTPARPHSLAVLTPPSLRVQKLIKPVSGTRPAMRPLQEGWSDDEDVTPPPRSGNDAAGT